MRRKSKDEEENKGRGGKQRMRRKTKDEEENKE